MEMEEYLKNMRSLRSQMNDIEEEAAKRSVQEQKQITAIDTMGKDLELVKMETKRLNEEAEELVRAKEQLGCQIFELQKKIRSLETESSTLSQTLELLQQEKHWAAAKFEEKRNYYTKTLKDLDVKLLEQQDWFNNHKISIAQLVEVATEKAVEYTEGRPINTTVASGVKLDMGEETSENYNNLLVQMEHAMAELDELNTKKSETELASNKSKQLFVQFSNKLNTVPQEVKEMDMKSLEEEHKALLADKAGETEYLHSLQAQVNQLKAISHVVNCPCGKEYTVNLMD